MAKVKKIDALRVQQFFVLAQELENEAHALGFHTTAHLLNKAKTKAGWEYADQVEKKIKEVREAERADG